MPDFTLLLTRWWKQVLLTVILGTAAAAIISFLQPKLYKSELTAIPASAFSHDRNRIFGENMQSLYSTLGTPDDLDRIIGIAHRDTVYRAVAIRLNGKEQQDEKSIKKIRDRVKVKKSAYGELLVQSWDEDASRAAKIANEVFYVLHEMQQSLQNAGNAITLQGLRDGRSRLQQADSIPNSSLTAQLEQYDKLIGQYQVLVDSKPPVLHIVESAQPTTQPDKPKTLRMVATAAFLSFLFGLLVAIALEAKRKSQLK